MKAMMRLWKLFLAWSRLSKSAVCEMSIGRSAHDDFHDYPDDKDKIPMHFCILKCERCGKGFFI